MDSIIVFPAGASGLASYGASAIQLGSWLNAQQGIDFGAKGLIQSIESSNALTDGGQFGFRFAPPRRMAIPLIINTASPAMWEGMLARAAMPGAMVALQPEGVPSSQAVFFDVLDGRWEPQYDVFHNRAGVRLGTLYLDTQPWGYWATEILLASSASVGWNGALPINGASIIGDVPPLAHVVIAPTSASVYMPTGSWFTDMIAWSFAGKPSFQPMIPANRFVFCASPPDWAWQGKASGYFAASLSADKYAPGSQGWIFVASYSLAPNLSNPGPWTRMFSSATFIPSGLEPAYRGRFRVFALTRQIPGDIVASEGPWSMIVDVAPYGQQLAMASSNQLATAANPQFPGGVNYIASGQGPGVFSMTPTQLVATCYQIADLGEIAIPPVASGFQGPVELRVWMSYPSGGEGYSATQPYLWFGGLCLLPVDGAAGVLIGGAAFPSVGAITPTQFWYPSGISGSALYNYGASPASIMQGQFEMAARFSDSYLVTNPAGSQALGDVRALHRGVAPVLGASTNQLVIVMGDKRAGATTPMSQANFEFAEVNVSYRPQFQFLFGV